MRISIRIFLLLIVILLFTSASCTKRNAYDELNDRIIVLFQQGQYSEAEKLAKEAVTMARDTFGPGHSKVAGALDTLAMVFSSQGKYDQAEPLYRQALTILESRLGPEHPDLAPVLENMAGLYRTIGNKEEAEKFTARLKALRAGH
jgi:tetratricopeptide (TPR) repeat protein